MARAADRTLTLVVDPDDDVAVLARLRRLHARPYGQVVCESGPAGGSAWLARSLLAALGKNLDVEPRCDPLWTLVDFHLRAQRIRDLIVLRAHAITYPGLRLLARAADAANTHLWLIIPCRRAPAAVAQLLEAIPHDTITVDELLTHLPLMQAPPGSHDDDEPSRAVRAATRSTQSGQALEPLNHTDVLALMGACSPRAPTGIRNRALLAVLYRSGVRISEALALEVRDVDGSACTLDIRDRNGSRKRIAGMDEDAFAFLERWLDVRQDLTDPRRHVFCTLKGTTLSAGYVRHLLLRLAKRAGIDKRVNPYALRRMHAYELVREHELLSVILGQLGPTSLATGPPRTGDSFDATRVARVRARTGWTNACLNDGLTGAE